MANFKLLMAKVAASGGGGGGTTIPTSQTIEFGALTRRGHGGHALDNTGGTLTITSDPSGLFAIDTHNCLVVAGTFGAAPPTLTGPYSVVVNNGTESSTATVNIVASTYSVTSINSGTNVDSSSVFQLDTALTIANMAQTVQIRDGAHINPTNGDWRCYPGVNAGVTSTFTGNLFTINSDYSVTDNFAGQYVKVKPDTPLGAKIGRFMLSGNTRHAMGIHLEDIAFEWLYTGSYINGGILTFGNNSTNYTSHTKLTGCTFNSNPTALDYGEAAHGIVGAVNTQQVWIDNCSGDGLHFAINISGTRTADDYQSAPTRICVRKCTFQHNFEDGIKLSAADDCHTLFNTSINFNLVSSTGAHPDHEQRTTASGSPGGTAGTYQFGSCIGNIYVRGEGNPSEPDGQGMFQTTTVSGFVLTGGRVAGNLIITAYQNSVYVVGTTDMIFEFNTIVRPSDTSVISNDQGFWLTSSATGGVGRYNVTFSTTVFNLLTSATAPPVQAGNIGGIKDAQYAAAYVSPLFGSDCNTKTKAIANFTGKAGGPLDPAITGQTYWAGAFNNAFIDHVAGTYTPPA